VNIKIEDRHRAAGDALATVKLFELLQGLDQDRKLFSKQNLPRLHPLLKEESIHSLPEETGVYYFLDENRDPVYIGKSKNIHRRVLSHFANNSSKRAMEMRDRTAYIDFVITGSDLVACLLESNEIKLQKPVFNRAQRRESSYSGIFSFYNEEGYLEFKIDKISSALPLAAFSSVEKAKQLLERLNQDLNLCQKFMGLYKTDGACFHHQVGICRGACVGAEEVASYNKRAEDVKREFDYKYDTFLIIDSGRRLDEKSVIKIENGKFRGYGYFQPDITGDRLEIIQECIKIYQDNRDIQSIIKRYVRQNKVERIIPL